MTAVMKSLKPYNPSTRFVTFVQKDYEDKSKPCKFLLSKQIRSSGRDNHGHVSSRFRGGGHKKMYRIISWKYSESDFGNIYEIMSFQYDPNRNVPIALIKCISGSKVGKYSYIIRAEGMKIGQDIKITKEFSDMVPGYILPLKAVPIGSLVHCVEMKPFKGAQIARSAGASIQVVGRDSGYVIVKLPSGETRKILESCLCSLGAVDNKNYFNTSIGKAGRNRWKGRMPHVRGVAMNPVDHPLGGGEGKTSGGRHPVSPWGKNCKGKKTRHNHRTSKFIISRKKKSN